MRRSVDVCPMTSLTESTVAVAALTWLTQLVFGELPVDSRTHERPSGRESGIFRLLTARVRTGLVAAAVAATAPMIAFAETTEPVIESAPVAAKEAEANANPTGDENDTSMQRAAIPAPAEVGLQRHFNELRGELLDDRSAYIDRWLSVVTIVLTFFGIVTVVGGYIGFRRFREIETEAKNSVATVTKLAEAAQRNLEEIEKNRKKSDEILRGLNAETAAADPQEAEQAVANVRENPTASLVDQVIALAVSLQQQDKREEAIEKWRAVAHISEAIDNDLAARAWFSVGYLFQKESETEADGLKLEEAIAAYDEAIRLNPNYAEAYNNRGVAKKTLGRHDAAIADCDEAIRLKPDYVQAYYNRGIAKGELEQYEYAIADFDEAIRLEPNYAKAYNKRGAAKAKLGRHDAAIADYDEAIRLNPNLAEAYYNRGNAKSVLGQHEAAVADYAEAIRLKPDFAEAYYTRGLAKKALGLVNEARADFENTLVLARNANNANLVALAEQWLRSLDAAGGT